MLTIAATSNYINNVYMMLVSGAVEMHNLCISLIVLLAAKYIEGVCMHIYIQISYDFIE